MWRKYELLEDMHMGMSRHNDFAPEDEFEARMIMMELMSDSRAPSSYRPRPSRPTAPPRNPPRESQRTEPQTQSHASTVQNSVNRDVENTLDEALFGCMSVCKIL